MRKDPLLRDLGENLPLGCREDILDASGEGVPWRVDGARVWKNMELYSLIGKISQVSFLLSIRRCEARDRRKLKTLYEGFQHPYHCLLPPGESPSPVHRSSDWSHRLPFSMKAQELKEYRTSHSSSGGQKGPYLGFNRICFLLSSTFATVGATLTM